MSLANPHATVIPRADTRGAIVDALNTVPDVTGYPSTPDVPAAGAGWPVWVQNTYNGRIGCPAVPTYDVYVLLPADYRPETVTDGDGLEPAVVGALWNIGTVQLSEPVAVQFDSTVTMPGIRVRLLARH